MKVVINDRHSGFGVSEELEAKYKGILGISNPDFCASWDIPRNCPVLVALVEEMGERANDTYSRLKVVEVPDDIDWYIEEYDGIEHVAEVHRTWR